MDAIVFKRLKSLFIIFIVISFSFNSTAAVVSDNDGAAFISKAEFDSLKNDFQAQINQYNTAIDNKIDNSIASYLAGINITKTTKLTDEIAKAKDNNVDNVTFALWQTPAPTKHVADAKAAFFVSVNMGSNNERWSGQVHGFHIINNMDASGNLKYQDYLGADNAGSKADYTSAYYFVNFPFGKLDDANNVTTGNTDDWYLMSLLRNRVHFILTTKENRFGTGHFSPTAADWRTHFYHPTSKTLSTDFTSSSLTKNGPGSYVWTSTIHAMQLDVQPTSTVEHQWSFNDATNDAIQNDFLNYNISGTIPNSTINCIDFNYRDKYVDGNFYNYMIQKTAPTTATHAGGNSCSEIYVLRWNGSSDETWYNGSTRYEAMNDYTFRFKWNIQKNYNLNWTKLTNKYYCERFGAPHYKYQGIPICITPNKKGKFKLKLKFINSRTDSGSPLSFTYQIMDKKFNNGAMPTEDREGEYDHVLKREVILDGNATKEVELELNKSTIWDSTKGDWIYIKIQPSSSYQRVSVETVGDIMYTESN